jgi:nicotinamidase-related amidase
MAVSNAGVKGEASTEKVILVGMVANTCIESTARFGMELGARPEIKIT